MIVLVDHFFESIAESLRKNALLVLLLLHKFHEALIMRRQFYDPVGELRDRCIASWSLKVWFNNVIWCSWTLLYVGSFKSQHNVKQILH